MKRATVITDASWCPETKVGGWACWIAADGVSSQGFSGPIPDRVVDSSGQAELFAAGVGVKIALENFGASQILLQSDCLQVEHVLRDPAKRSQYFPQGVRLHFRHVKGHTKHEGARFWVNRWCDKHAKGHMREARDARQATG